MKSYFEKYRFLFSNMNIKFHVSLHDLVISTFLKIKYFINTTKGFNQTPRHTPIPLCHSRLSRGLSCLSLWQNN